MYALKTNCYLILCTTTNVFVLHSTVDIYMYIYIYIYTGYIHVRRTSHLIIATLYFIRWFNNKSFPNLLTY